MNEGESDTLDVFSISLEVVIRSCREYDLPALENLSHREDRRERIRRAFDRQMRGEGLMLIANANGTPIGQVWIDLSTKSRDSIGILWALKVLPSLQHHGLGSRLVVAGERSLTARSYDFAELGVEVENIGARRLYERLGYRVVDSRVARSDGSEHLILRKRLWKDIRRSLG